MEEKSYGEMKKEFMFFYHNEVKDKLPAYEKARKEGALKIFFFNMTWFSFIFIFVLVPLIGMFKLNCSGSILIFLGCIPLISMFCLSYLTRNDPKTGRNSTTIKTNYEMDLKRPLMSKFVKIFLSDAQWKKGLCQNQNSATVPEISNIFAKIKQIRLQNILNPFPWLVFDDIVCGEFKNVQINIYESNTNIFNYVTVYIIPFVIIWITGMTAGLIWILFILLFLIFSWKIFQYAPFRGVIVEIEMNKNFTGHTFFHEKSITARKIPINKKKYTPVQLEKSAFSDKYQVFSDNQIDARYLLTTAMMERIENLSFAFKAKSVRGSFKDNKLMLAINTGVDMFAMGNDFKASNTDTFSHLYNEMVSVLQIVDELKLNQQTGL